jgi:hypothetical protein
VELAVRDTAHLAVIGFEKDGGLIRLRLQVAIEAVVGRVQLAILEPLEKRRVRFVEHARERFVPEQLLAREPRPETAEVALRFRAEFPIGFHAGDIRAPLEVGRRREDAVFLQH